MKTWNYENMKLWKHETMETHFLTGNTQCLCWKCWSKHAPGTPGIPKKFQVFPVKNEHFPQNFVFSYRPFHTAFSTEQNSCAINKKIHLRWMQHCDVISGMGLESNHWIRWHGLDHRVGWGIKLHTVVINDFQKWQIHCGVQHATLISLQGQAPSTLERR